MTYLASLIVSGLMVGALYGLIAMGFAVIYKVSKVVNFAQGEVMMLIAYTAYSVALRSDASTPLIAATVIVMAVVVGALLERLIVRPMLGKPVFALVMMTIALAFFIRSIIGLIWGADSHRFPGGGAAMWQFMGVTIDPTGAALFVIYAAMSAAAWAFLRFSVFGIAMRATAVDATVAMLMGVSVRKVYRSAWIFAALLAGTAGVLFAKLNIIGPDMNQVGIRAFPATILGGLDSILGSGLGGLIIGVVENLAGGYIGSSFKEIAGFMVVLVVLMVRPYGLFGEKDIERV
jgi:branched-chain amino acid transport system permease protein